MRVKTTAKITSPWIAFALGMSAMIGLCLIPLIVLQHHFGFGFGGVMVWWAALWCVVKARELWVARKARQARRTKRLIYGGPPLRYRDGHLDTYWRDRTYNP